MRVPHSDLGCSTTSFQVRQTSATLRTSPGSRWRNIASRMIGFRDICSLVLLASYLNLFLDIWSFEEVETLLFSSLILANCRNNFTTDRPDFSLISPAISGINSLIRSLPVIFSRSGSGWTWLQLGWRFLLPTISVHWINWTEMWQWRKSFFELYFFFYFSLSFKIWMLLLGPSGFLSLCCNALDFK